MDRVSEELPIIYLARHGETPWSLTGQHTGLTDLPLTERGESNARRLLERLSPDWQLFRDGCPGGESPQQVAARADRVTSRVRAVPGNVLLFSSGHFLRMLAARRTGVETSRANAFMLSTASLSALGCENSREHPVIQLWNETHHLRTSDDRQTDANRLSSTGVIQ